MGGVEVKIRPLQEGEFQRAAALVRDSFLLGTAPLFSPEGIRAFLCFGCTESIKERVHQGSLVAGAFEGARLVGVVELRQDFHLSMLFVAPDQQGGGIGKALIRWGLEKFSGDEGNVPRVTVNSSPNAEGFYRSIGFEALEPEKDVDGIRFIPMVLPSTEVHEGGS